MIEVEYLHNLTLERRNKILTRSRTEAENIKNITAEILARLKKDPQSELLREYRPLKPNLLLSDFKVGEAEIEAAFQAIPPKVLVALKQAAEAIHKFHTAQLDRPAWFDEFAPGLLAGRLTRPLDRVGVYIPGGRAAYPSSALMNIIPARAAGVKEIVATSPPGPDFTIRAEILVATHLAGADAIYKLGGAWAVGTLTYGLGVLAPVDKIVGPGSAWVTAAKMAVFGQVDIDLPAGPSEGFIIADGTAQPTWLAWDFLAQLEHDPQAAAVLITTSEEVAIKTTKEIKKIFPTLVERRKILTESLQNGAAILVADNINEAFDFANLYAPEHLQLVVTDPFSYLTRIRHAGSVFLGPYSPIPAGDYASGPNHVLPTAAAARMFSGLSTDSFLKKITFQHLTREALENITPTVTTLAKAEGFLAHAQTLEIRRNKK